MIPSSLFAYLGQQWHFITFGSIVVATAAAVFQRLLQNAVDVPNQSPNRR